MEDVEKVPVPFHFISLFCDEDEEVEVAAFVLI
jgi:hypothetical protein